MGAAKTWDVHAAGFRGGIEHLQDAPDFRCMRDLNATS